MNSRPIPFILAELLNEARERTLALVADLDDQQMIGPRLNIVNPLRWEIGHIAWFQEYWILRQMHGRAPMLAAGDNIYDSARVAHETRWDLPLPSKAETITYMQGVLDQVLDLYSQKEVAAELSDDDAYFLSLVLLHEDMHAEAITYTRQTLAFSAPRFDVVGASARTNSPVKEVMDDPLSDVEIHGGLFLLGSIPGKRFGFDNEMRAHEVQVQPYKISRTAVTNAQYAAFVDDGGYERRGLWSNAGWRWRESTGAKHPVYWRFIESKWWRRNFNEMVQLEDHLPVLHVNWYEADAFCLWARRRLPTEAEWEMAASAEPTTNGHAITWHKRQFPWGDEAPTSDRANLDWRNMGCVDVRALPLGDSAFGCRQMIGNVWEWTASDFKPYPGFVAGPTKNILRPGLGTTRYCAAVAGRLART
ncbi:MAG TPA: SUMF1/EgtB/PvdO family nonheme iron enzyme [Pyrinomonadaceae bacterium]|nr:SUMF1/EgtB/PvdO family nonheme iron enzyme [Pyrinomonadaceae bacterium]